METMGRNVLIEAPPIGRKVSNRNENIMRQWAIKITEGGRELTPEDYRMALTVMREWDEPSVKGRPSLVGAYMGFGKSALLSEYLWNKLRDQDVETGRQTIRTDFGAIIVLPKREQVKTLVDYLNAGPAVDSAGKMMHRNTFAFGLYGFDPDAEDGMTPTYNAYREQETEQVGYNVLVMTHEKLKHLTLQGKIDKYRSFYNEQGRRCDRPRLIVDEKPSIVEHHKVTQRDLNEVIEWATLQDFEKKPHYGDIYEQVRKLRDFLENPIVEDKALIYPEGESEDFRIDQRIAYMLGDANDFGRLEKLRGIEHIARHGGRVSKYKNESGKQVRYFSCATKVHYDWTQLNASILDGTGHLALEMALVNESEKLTHIRPENTPAYHNLSFYVSKAENLSRSSLKGKKEADVVAKMKTYCEQIQRKHPETKFLVITYKRYQESLNHALEGNDKLTTKYFDGGRATNDYIDCDGVIFLGNYFKPSDFYISMASTINGRSIEFCEATDSRGKHFKDEDVENFKLTNQLEDFMQELARTRPVQKSVQLPVYMFTKDEGFIEQLKQECPGAEFGTYEAPTKLSGKETAKHKVTQMILLMKPGEEVHKATWYKDNGISRKAFADSMNTQVVKEAMQENGVIVKGHFLIKEN
ncbi:hypothetical protein ACFQIC_12925 [Halobacillus seohaensis]|uniref:Uncharacterized protein n=2 Tax=Halobacillus seohaensis TaxID=447421 RepID=A0ABW2EPG0_9BACI